MKTKALLSIQVLGIISTTMISCSKEDRIGPQELAVSTPILHHIIDSLYTPFFTSGNNSEAIYVSWGNEKGNLSVTSPSKGGIIVKNEAPYELTWDQNFGLGNYTITLTAQNSKGIANDNFVLVSYFGGDFVMTYNRHPESSINGLSVQKPMHFDQKGGFWCLDPWDSANSIAGKWSWVSKDGIKGSYSHHGQIDDYSFKVTLIYNKETGLPQLNGYWYEGEPVLGKEKGYISLNFDKDSEFAISYDDSTRQWQPSSEQKDYPQIYHPFDPINKDNFGGWFTAVCDSFPNEKDFRLYLGVDKKIFRGVKNPKENWSWVSENEIQGTFMEHSDFPTTEKKYITFRGAVSMDSRGFPIVIGRWYQGKEAVQGAESGKIKMYYENWDDWWGAGW